MKMISVIDTLETTPGVHTPLTLSNPIRPSSMIHLIAIAFNLFDFISNVKARRTDCIYLELSRLRSLYQIELDFRDLLLRASHSRFCYSTTQLNIPVQGLLVGDSQKPSHNLSNPQLAELRAWQQVCLFLPSSPKSRSHTLLDGVRTWYACTHLLITMHRPNLSPACIDTALTFLSNAVATDVLTMRICETMFTTILSLPPPCPHPQPAQPRPDDKDRVTDRRVLYDEPLMRSLISSFDDESRQLLKGATERERARLPLFPSSYTPS